MKRKQRNGQLSGRQQCGIQQKCMEELYGRRLGQVIECMEELNLLYRSGDESAAAAEQIEEWRYRYMEMRGVLAEQYRCIAGMLEQVQKQLCGSSLLEGQAEEQLQKMLRANRLVLEASMMLEKGDRHREAVLYIHSMDDVCIPAEAIMELLEKLTGTGWMLAADSRTIVTKHSSLIHLEEQSKFFLKHGLARAIKTGGSISGDSFSFEGLPDGKWMLALCDGMGAGMRANRESRLAVELLEHMMEAGFLPETALQMLHNTLLLQEQELRPVTMDLAVVDLYTGMADFYKSGAVTSFVRHENGTELLRPEALPMGYLPGLQPAHHVCRLQDGDYIIMMTDGMLEALEDADKEAKWIELIERLHVVNPKDLANKLLIYAMAAVDGEPPDDMTVLVSGVWRK